MPKKKSVKKKNKPNKFDKYLLLSWRKAWIIVVGCFAAVMLHNLVSVIIHSEEAFFFIIAIFVIPIYVIITVIYSLARLIMRKSK